MTTIAEAKKMCDTNFLFFQNHLDELCMDHYGKFLSIKNESVIGAYDSFDQAYASTAKTEELGTFLIMHCVRANETAVYNFYSQNVEF